MAPDLGGDGKFHNFMPGEEHTYIAHRIPLTLDQMKAVDLGGPVRIVVEDYTYGNDELFYQDALNAGVLIALEDGTDDGDEAIDTYLIPTWGDETVLDVLAHYFPHETDADGNLVAIWTPEYRADTPAWCIESRRVGTTLWCKHALSTADWWNVYLNGLGDGTEGFQDTPAAPGSVALFRFNKDSDLDGYSDRSEARLGTNPRDASSHPKPELIAGVHSIRAGNHITATLSFLNTGLYDAYGVEAVMIAPDDSVDITNNTVGGSGRVRAQRQVIVGSRILPPTYTVATWHGTARPASGGYYTGSSDRAYAFTVQCANPGGCDVGAGTWSLAWTDGAGNSGTLNFGASYASPTFLDVGTLGVKLALYTGKVYNGDTFTVEARTPRDTFQYTINREPYTEPVVLVSYNDPQGNHRFITPVRLSTPAQDLVPYSGQMLPDPGVEIVTTAPFTVGVNTTNLVVNNPTGVTLSNAHLFLEFVNISGTVACEVPATVTVPAGPRVVPVTWNTGVFSPAFQSNQDYIVMAFWTDYQGNILDTAARPLTSFQADPKPAFAMSAADATWDFGTAAQGCVLKRTFNFANTGYLDLLTYVSAPLELNVSQTGSRRVVPADVTTYEIVLKTADLSTGPYSGTITIRTSDPNAPARTVHVVGTITSGTPDTPPGSVQRPLDWSAYIAGNHNAYEWVEFTHNLGPDPQNLHPVKVYSQDYGTIWGVGKYATPFGQGTTSYDMFGDGSDGDLVVGSGETAYTDDVRAALGATASTGQLTLTLASTGIFTSNMVGDRVLVIQMQGAGAGNYELGTIAGVEDRTLTLTRALSNTYNVDGNSKAQVLRVPQYRNVTVQNGGTLTAHAWNGDTGGIVVLACSSEVEVQSGGNINVDEKGYRGAPTWQETSHQGTGGFCGEGEKHPIAQVVEASSWTNPGDGNWTWEYIEERWGPNIMPNGVGGGGADSDGNGGGGGSNGTYGDHGQIAVDTWGNSGGHRGDLSPTDDLTRILFGGGGGSGGNDGGNPGGGGNGGGIVMLFARTVSVDGTISSAGGDGEDGGSGFSNGAGGGGAGGSILIKAETATLGNNLITAQGGARGLKHSTYGHHGGAGGTGRVRIEYCDTISGSTDPPASTQKLNCYICEQIDSPPYDRARLNLPESFTGGRTYQVQYGRRLVFGGAGEQTATLRVPAGAFTTATLDALVSEVGTGGLTFRLDVGNDGSWDWEWTGDVTNATTLNSPGLASAFNAYWATHGAPTSGTVDVPIKVFLGKAGQLLISNLQFTPTGSKLRAVRLPARTYSTVALNLTVGESGSGPLTLAADVGDNGTVDWTYTGSSSYPAHLTTGNLASAVNAYLSGHTGEVDVPIRFYLAPFLSLKLTGFNAIPSAQPDLTPLSLVGRGAGGEGDIVEGDTALVTATIRNNGPLDADGLTAAFYATAPGWGDWYIGSAFVSDVPAGGTAPAVIQWNTLGFTGSVPVRVVADPYNRLAESNEGNNQATTSLTIRTRPDLRVTNIALSDGEPMVSETITVTLTLYNAGQTAAGAESVALYRGNPDAGGTLLGARSVSSVAGGASRTVTFTWTPTSPGPHRLFARADRNRQVNEYDEGNNDAWRDVYVGFRGPILVDSGGASDLTYTPATGYGYLNPGTRVVVCGGGSAPEDTLRAAITSTLYYRFDHLLPGHFYHLDLTLRDCDGNRAEEVYVDDTLVIPAVDLSDHQPHRLSILLDPAFYADHLVVVGVAETHGLDAMVAEVNLHDVDYRYADAGGSNDPAYPAPQAERPYGWLDGESRTSWGNLPYQSRRVDLADTDPSDDPDSELRYRFDKLDPARRYRLHLSFYQKSGATIVQKVQVDGTDASPSFNLDHAQSYSMTLAVPLAAYQTDDSIVVGVVRVDCATSEAFVNEIALEEETLPADSPCVVTPTPSRTIAYGNVTIGGQPAPVGTVIQALNPRDDVVGCKVVQSVGQYPYTQIYGESGSIPGMRAGEIVEFRVNGIPAVATPSLYWQNDWASHRVDLSIGSTRSQCSWLSANWNLISFRLQPPVPTVEDTLRAIQGRYCRVLGENGVYSCELDPVYRTLKEMHPGLGYYLQVTGATGVNLRMEGMEIPVTTPIPLHTYWNWVGYLPPTTLPITTALQSIEGHYLMVLSLDRTYNPAHPEWSDLLTMEPGQGYQIRATDPVTLTYPAGGGLLTSPTTAAKPASGCIPTPYRTLLRGHVTIGGLPAPVGTRVEVLTPRGDVAGYTVMWQTGHYGYVQVYGEDDSDPPTPGFRLGEPLTFRVNGLPATSSVMVTWANDLTPHVVDLTVETQTIYLPLVLRSQ